MNANRHMQVKKTFLQKGEGEASYRPFAHDVTLYIWRTALRIISYYVGAMGLLTENNVFTDTLYYFQMLHRKFPLKITMLITS